MDILFIIIKGCHCGCDSMVVVFTTTYAFSASNPAHGEVHSIQHYVTKFVSDLRQVGGLSGYFRFLHQ